MAQVLRSTAKSVLAVPVSVCMAGSSLAFTTCVPSRQVSTPALTRPAAKAGVAMAMAVLEPSAPASR